VTYAETIEFLFSIRLFGQKLGLETMEDLTGRLGHPERGLRFLHIAGTNGKGSTAAMCAAVLATAGYRVGLYTSPHLVSFCERFQINGAPIPEAEVVRLVAELCPVLAQCQPRPPTFFEVVTGLALRYFSEQRVEYVVWETGLGGRLDATNIVTPVVAIITSLGFDHRQYLGDTIEQIAGEKAGIIKPGVPVVTSATGPALEVIRQVARARQAPLTVVTASEFTPPLPGRHQVLNCAAATAALRICGIRDAQIRAGLPRTCWPGRFQIVPGAPPMVLDGAHNAPAAEALAAALREHFPGQRLALVLGILRDKETAAICRQLAPLAPTIGCVPVQSERSSPPAEIADLCRQANPSATVRIFEDLDLALTTARAAAEVVAVTGSLFLVGETLRRLGLATAPTTRELGLQ
jgi:dihydrofolate synthase/folylpolyglutamate synthase